MGRNGRPNSFAICNFQKHKSEFVFVSNDLIWQKFSIWLMEPIFHEPIHTLTPQFEIKMVFKIYIFSHSCWLCVFVWMLLLWITSNNANLAFNFEVMVQHLYSLFFVFLNVFRKWISPIFVVQVHSRLKVSGIFDSIHF